jgi:DNA-binding transcriptional LysR family regulator
MNRVLDIAPLRSLVAVADCGGFLRAAAVLHLSQAAVSQHVRRLESAIGRPLVERHGRGSRFTSDGERLLGDARRLLAMHDSVLSGFGASAQKTVVIGSTEHAAAQLLPPLAAELERTLPDHAVRLRIDRGTRLREGLASRSIDLALLLGPAHGPQAIAVGDLELNWYSGPRWVRPVGRPLPLAAFDDPCALRTRARGSAHGDSRTDSGRARRARRSPTARAAGARRVVATGAAIRNGTAGVRGAQARD